MSAYHVPAYYVYLYKDPSRNNEPIYVGKGSGQRAWDHLKSKNTKSHFINRLRLMKNNGVEPLIEMLAEVDDEEVAFSLELWFIYKIGRRDQGRGPLCNLTDGGDGITNLSPEAKARSLEKRRGQKRSQETCKNISNSLKGKKRGPLSEDHKKKISKGCTGQRRTEEQCINISTSLKGKTKGIPKAPFSGAHKESIRQVRLGKKHSEEAKANMRKPKSMKANMRACTNDGINIFASVKEMVTALGSGKNGTRSPNFRYV